MDEGEVNRTGCVKTDNQSCCTRTYDIGVKNCTDFNVYKLKPTTACPEAYCIGEQREENSKRGRAIRLRYETCSTEYYNVANIVLIWW